MSRMTEEPETQVVVELVLKELQLARRKFPKQSRDTTLLALVEEVGELAQAHLQGKSEMEIHYEAVQVAAMAIRVILDTER